MIGLVTLAGLALQVGPTVTEPPPPQGPSLADLTQAVQSTCGLRLVYREDELANYHVSAAFPEDPAATLAIYKRALRTCQFALFPVPGVENTFTVGQCDEALDVPRYARLEDLPAGDDLCELLLDMQGVSADQSMIVVSKGITERLRSRTIVGSTVLLRDYATNLRSVGEILERLDRNALAARRAVRIEIVYLESDARASAEQEEYVMALLEGSPSLLDLLGSGRAQVIGQSSCVVHPPRSGEVPSMVHMVVGLSRPASGQQDVRVQFSPHPEGQQVRLSGFGLLWPMFIGDLILRPGRYELATEATFGDARIAVLVRATVVP